MTRIILCGSRDFDDYELFYRSMDENIVRSSDVQLVSGHSRGVDLFAERYAEEKDIPIAVFNERGIYEWIRVAVGWNRRL